MTQELMKVTFTLIPSAGFTSDEKEQKELNEMARRRNGLYLGSTEVLENDLKTLKLVIEDEGTGEIYEVDPLLVKFNK